MEFANFGDRQISLVPPEDIMPTAAGKKSTTMNTTTSPSLFPLSAPADRGITCRHCGKAAFTTAWQTFSDGSRHVRMSCAGCGRFTRYLPQHKDGTPRYRIEYSTLPTDHPGRKLPTDVQWIGMVRAADEVWRTVGMADSLEKCWDVVLSYRGEGDRLCCPTERP
jgi:hypothetical protein